MSRYDRDSTDKYKNFIETDDSPSGGPLPDSLLFFAAVTGSSNKNDLEKKVHKGTSWKDLGIPSEAIADQIKRGDFGGVKFTHCMSTGDKHSDGPRDFEQGDAAFKECKRVRSFNPWTGQPLEKYGINPYIFISRNNKSLFLELIKAHLEGQPEKVEFTTCEIDIKSGLSHQHPLYNVTPYNQKEVNTFPSHPEILLQPGEKTQDGKTRVYIRIALDLDCTQSMSPYITEAKKAAKKVGTDLAAKVERILTEKYPDEAKDGFDIVVRTAVVGYRDVSDTKRFEYLDFTGNMNKVSEFIGNLSASGGGDFPEDVLGAFVHTTRLFEKECRHEKDHNKHFNVKQFYLITDAPGHGSWMRGHQRDTHDHEFEEKYWVGSSQNTGILAVLRQMDIDMAICTAHTDVQPTIDFIKRHYDQDGYNVNVIQLPASAELKSSDTAVRAKAEAACSYGYAAAADHCVADRFSSGRAG